MATSSRRRRRPPAHLKISVIGCGAVARWLVRPLASYLVGQTQDTFEISFIDGQGDKPNRLAEELRREFPSLPLTLIPEYVVQRNIVGLIENEAFVFVAVNNQATLKLISDHTVTLRDVTVITGGDYWSDGQVRIQMRRNGKNVTPPLANRYHPEIVTPHDHNPGDLPPSERKPIVDEPRLSAMTNLVAAWMVAMFYRIQSGEFMKMPEYNEFYLDAAAGELVGRPRVE